MQGGRPLPMGIDEKANLKNQEVSILEQVLISNSNKSAVLVPISVAQIQAPLEQKPKQLGVRAEMENKIFMPKHSLLFGLREDEDFETNMFKSQQSNEESIIGR